MTDLTDDEKNKIRLEELYRQQIKEQLPKHRSFFDRFDGPIKMLQGTAIAIGIYASLYQYVSNSKKEREEAAREYQKSFYQAQMAVYAEAVEATSIISTAVPDSGDYKKAREKFFDLFWGRMSMFEDKCVEARMVQFRELLIKFEQHVYTPVKFDNTCGDVSPVYDTIDQVSLKMASLRLAHQCRLYTIQKWLPLDEQKEYNLVGR